MVNLKIFSKSFFLYIMNKHLKIMKKTYLALLPFSALVLSASIALFSKENYQEVSAASEMTSLPTTIYLDDSTESDIREYYSPIDSLTNSKKTGTNLLAELKKVLKNGQRIFKYDDSSIIWKMYEITDRDWEKSPASDLNKSGSYTYGEGNYNATTNVITNYKYGKSVNSHDYDPYIHALYYNRDADNKMTAWANHTPRTVAYCLEREHIWPKSRGFEEEEVAGARGDPMHLWAAEGNANGIHSNNFYGYVDTTKNYTDVGTVAGTVSTYAKGNLSGKSKSLGGSLTVFEPQDCDKGDIARAIFYMAARYNNIDGSDNGNIDSANPNLTITNTIETGVVKPSDSSPATLGILSDLLEWHRNDPVDYYEIHRNNLLYRNYSKNRNPFIDYPGWVDLIWGSGAGSTYASPANNTIYEGSSYAISKDGSETVSVSGVSLNKTSLTLNPGDTETLTATVLPNNATNKSVTWTSSNTTVATVANNGLVTAKSEGSTTITVKTNDGNKTATCTVTVNAGTIPVDDDDLVTDELTITKSNFGSDSGYQNWKNPLSDVTDASYIGYSNKADFFQLRTSDNTAGIITTASGGYLRKITIEWGSSTKDGRKLDIYGSNAAYTSTTDLFDTNKQGTKLGSITYHTTDAETELTIDGNYKYIGLRFASDAIYMDKISIGWELIPEVTGLTISSSALSLDVYSNPNASLTAEITVKNGASDSLEWSSSNNAVVDVDEEGHLTALKAGSATITVASMFDSSFSDTCSVTVTDSTPAAEALKGTGAYSKVSSQLGIDNGNLVESFNFDSNGLYSVAFSKGTNTNNAPRYYSKGSSVRTYGGNTFTITGKSITKIVFTFGSEDGTNSINASSGNYDDNGTWIALEYTDSITFTIGGSSGQRRIASFTIFYYCATDFATDFLAGTGCDSTGKTAPTGNWSTLTSYYNRLNTVDKNTYKTADAKETGTLIEQAAKRHDYIVWLYGNDGVHTDFMDRGVTPRSSQSINVITSGTIDNSSLIVIIAAIASTLSIVSLVIIKKRKIDK